MSKEQTKVAFLDVPTIRQLLDDAKVAHTL